MEQRPKITLEDSGMDLMVKMSEGNPGALTVLMKLLEQPDLKPPGPLFLLVLDDMNIRGPQIWVGYKDYCKEDIPAFVKAIEKRDPEMIALINEVCGHEHTATDGAQRPQRI